MNADECRLIAETVQLDADEWYPVYGVTRASLRRAPPEFRAEYLRVMREFNGLQRTLRKVRESQLDAYFAQHPEAPRYTFVSSG